MYRAAGLQANGVQIVPSLLKSTDVALHGACFWATNRVESACILSQTMGWCIHKSHPKAESIGRHSSADISSII